jgi:magnesium transporter
MILVNVHTTKHGLENNLPLTAIDQALARDEELLWLEVRDPEPGDFEVLREEFGFHPLAMEDLARRRQRPKIDVYDSFLHIVFYALMLGMQEAPFRAVQVDLLVGKNYVVTVHDGALDVIQETCDRWIQNLERIGQRDVGILVYSILDAVVDAYFPIVDAFSDRIEELEEAMFERADQDAQQEIFRLKRDLLMVRRILAPERDVLNALVRRDMPVFDARTIVYFQDVYDHVLRVADAVETYRELVSSALDAYLSAASNRLNRVMKTLTASSIILMSVTLIASIYGMNFVHMPELDWGLGYLWALGLMAVIAGTLTYVFRRMDYF